MASFVSMSTNGNYIPAMDSRRTFSPHTLEAVGILINENKLTEQQAIDKMQMDSQQINEYKQVRDHVIAEDYTWRFVWSVLIIFAEKDINETVANNWLQIT